MDACGRMEIKKNSRVRKDDAVLFISGAKLRGCSRAGGAHVCAGAAILALGGVDHVGAVVFGDRALGALSFASAASDAFINVNLVRHGFILSLDVCACEE